MLFANYFKVCGLRWDLLMSVTYDSDRWKYFLTIPKQGFFLLKVVTISKAEMHLLKVLNLLT